jgi:ferric-dicitrate binding protein FerR (iron transport regulator)
MQRRFQRDTEAGARNDAALEEVRRLFERYRVVSAPSGPAPSNAQDRGPAPRRRGSRRAPDQDHAVGRS